jgi:hypothetical protein
MEASPVAPPGAVKTVLATPLLSVVAVEDERVPPPVILEKVTVSPATGVVPSSRTTVAFTTQLLLVVARREAAVVAGEKVREILFPVSVSGEREIINVRAEPVTLAKIISWMVKLGELFPAVYVAMAVPLASVILFTTRKAAPLLFVSNPKLTFNPDNSSPSSSWTVATMILISPTATEAGVASSVIVFSDDEASPPPSGPHPLRQQNRVKINSSSNVRDNFALVDFVILLSFS